MSWCTAAQPASALTIQNPLIGPRQAKCSAEALLQGHAAEGVLRGDVAAVPSLARPDRQRRALAGAAEAAGKVMPPEVYAHARCGPGNGHSRHS